MGTDGKRQDRVVCQYLDYTTQERVDNVGKKMSVLPDQLRNPKKYIGGYFWKGHSFIISDLLPKGHIELISARDQNFHRVHLSKLTKKRSELTPLRNLQCH